MLFKTIDLGYVLEIHAEITDTDRYTGRLLTSEGPRAVSLHIPFVKIIESF